MSFMRSALPLVQQGLQQTGGFMFVCALCVYLQMPLSLQAPSD